MLRTEAMEFLLWWVLLPQDEKSHGIRRGSEKNLENQVVDSRDFCDF